MKKISRREMQVLHLCAEGKTAPEIGGILGIAPETARKHRKAIIAAFGAANMVSAVAMAVALRIVTIDLSRCPIEAAAE